MIQNIGPRFVYEDWTELIELNTYEKPYIPTYKEIMRSRELDKGYKGGWIGD